MDWFLYDKGLRHERVNHSNENICQCFYRLSQNAILECAVFRFLPFIQIINKLHHIKIKISQNDKYPMFPHI